MSTVTKTVREGAAERLSRMIQIPTVSAELATRGREPFEAFVDLLHAEYPLIHERFTLERITDFGLLYHYATESTADPVVLMAHYDVVPVDESDAWTYPPFNGTIADDTVFGRGALDDKGPLLITMEAIENALADGYAPPRDLYISLGGNEETAGAAADAIAQTFVERGITPWLVLDEGGAVTSGVLPGVPQHLAMVGVAEKGALTVTLSAASEGGGHASFPPEVTTVGRVSRAVTRLTPTTFPAHTPQAISHLLATLAPGATGIWKTAYRVLSKLPRVSGAIFARIGGQPASLVRTTVAATKMQGGTADNVIPSLASATINMRVAIGETVPQTLTRVRKRIADPKITISVVSSQEPTPQSSSTNAQFDLIRAAVAVSHPEAITAPYITMAATDSRWFHRFSPAVYRFSPLFMSPKDMASIHGVDERVPVSELERGERFYRTLLESLPH